MGVTRRALLAIVLLTGCHSADDGASPVVADGATDSTTSDGSTMEETSTKIDAPMETDGSITKSDAVIDTGSTTPIDTGPPETSTANKVVFVTSTLYTGDLGGVAGADSKCQSAAAAASLAGTFKAWVSSATSSPSTTFVRTTGDYALPDGTVVAHGWSGLTSGTLLHAIDQTETKAAPPMTAPLCGSATANNAAYTGTTPTGVLASSLGGSATCSDWTSKSAGVVRGWPGATDGAWSSSCIATTGCDSPASLYCFEQ